MKKQITLVAIIVIVMWFLFGWYTLLHASQLENNLRTSVFMFSTVDMLQTTAIRTTPGVKEVNSYLGEQPKEEKIIPYFILSTLTFDYITQKVKSEYIRNTIYLGANLLEGYLVLKKNPPKGISNKINFYVCWTFKF